MLKKVSYLSLNTWLQIINLIGLKTVSKWHFISVLLFASLKGKYM